MKIVAILAVLAATVLNASAFAANAPQTHNPGDPNKQGQFCWVYTDGRGHGFWDACDPHQPNRGISLRGLTESAISAIENGGGGDGGGGGGGR